MRVGINTLFLIPGEVGGSETYLCETLLAVAQQYPDIELAFVTHKENDDFLKDRFGCFPACTFHRIAIRASHRCLRILTEQFRLPGVIQQIKPDVLWSPGYTMPFRVCCPQVVSLLDMQYRSHPDDLTTLARWVTHTLVFMASKRADAILTLSRFSKQEITRETGCPAERIHVTPLGVNPVFGQKGAQTCRPIAEPYILCVANSYPHKNLHTLAMAFGQVAGAIPHHLVLVGNPRRGERVLLQELTKLPQKRIHRLHGVSRAELINLYHDAALFVFPSLYEGFGLPALEAMMVGIPVLTSREGALPEISAEHAVYFDGRSPADLAKKMMTILEWGEEKRRNHVQAARLHAGRFLWNATADGTVTVWRELLASHAANQKGLAHENQQT